MYVKNEKTNLFFLAKEPKFIYTHHIQIKIRNSEKPQDKSLFLNETTCFAILIHELAHIKFSGHENDFMFFLRDLYLFGSKMFRIFKL